MPFTGGASQRFGLLKPILVLVLLITAINILTGRMISS